MPKSAYRRLDPALIVATVDRLRQRVHAEFPGSGLSRVGDALHEVAVDTVDDSRSVGHPIRWLQALVVVLLTGIPLTLIATVHQGLNVGIQTIVDLVTVLEAGLGTLVFIGAGIAFLITLETRIRQRRALAGIHQFRALSHIIDMHQLSKVPGLGMTEAVDGTDLRLSPAQLTSYYDLCSELLSLVAKVASLYVQELEDPVVIAAVDEIEELTTGLCRKIWQKAMVVNARHLMGRGALVG